MRLRITVCLFVLTLLSVALPSAVAAQERKGFWFGAGGGLGTAGISCDGCEGGRESSGVGYLRLGWTASDRLLIGGEINLWNKQYALEEGIIGTANLYNFSGTLTFYPSASAGFFVKGGAGSSTVDLDLDAEGTNITVEVGTGLGFLVGTGYDFRVGQRISITPGVNFWYGNLGDVTLRGQPFLNNFKHNVVDFTLGITFH